MRRYQPMDLTLRAAWCALLVGGVIAAGEILRAQGPDPIAHLGPEAWFVISGVLVTVGINLEQLRRVRSDVRELKSDGVEKHKDNTQRLDSVDHRLAHVEDSLKFLRRRRRDDRELEAEG